MDPEAYLACVDRFAAEAAQTDEFVAVLSDLKGVSAEADACAAFRREMATQSELDGVSGHLEIGYFHDADAKCREGWWLFFFDIGYAARRLILERTCARYSLSQPLFAGAPDLFGAIRRREPGGSADLELIDDRAVACVEGSEIYRVGNGFAKLTSQLAPNIANWARDAFPTAPRFLRLDPWEFHREQPLMRLEEAALVPANPRWLSTLALFPNTQTFAAYVLEDSDPAADREQFWEYRVQHIRRLEVTARRREPDYLSMMIEELPTSDDPSGLMVGRCIHLDTRAVIGTPMTEARLQHLDLAINVYQGADRALRMADTLQDGKVRDATFRTHLLRVEEVPFPALFQFAEMFLRSRILLREWVTDVMGTAPIP